MSPRRAPEPAIERRILIVEDNIDDARMLAALFGTMGHTAEYAINGIVALEMAPLFQPDFIFLDLKLPDGHGADIARKLRNDPKLAGARIYAVTGSRLELDHRRALAAGCEAVLTKPVASATFETLVSGPA